MYARESLAPCPALPPFAVAFALLVRGVRLDEIIDARQRPPVQADALCQCRWITHHLFTGV